MQMCEDGGSATSGPSTVCGRNARSAASVQGGGRAPGPEAGRQPRGPSAPWEPQPALQRRQRGAGRGTWTAEGSHGGPPSLVGDLDREDGGLTSLVGDLDQGGELLGGCPAWWGTWTAEGPQGWWGIWTKEGSHGGPPSLVGDLDGRGQPCHAQPGPVPRNKWMHLSHVRLPCM